MSTDRRRGVVLALAVVAVALGAALFPAAGLGTTPGGESGLWASGDATGADRPDSAGTPDGTATPGRTDTPTEGGTPTPGERPTATATTPSGGSTDASPTPAATPTATLTATPTPTDDEEESLVPVATGGSVLVVLVLALAVVLGRRSERETRASGGPRGAPGDVDRDGIGRWLGSPLALLARIPQATMVALVGFASAMARTVETLGRALAGLSEGFAVGFRQFARGATGMLEELARALAAFRLPDLSGPSVSGVFSGLGGGRADGRAPDADARTRADVRPADAESTPMTSVEDAWERFTDTVRVRRPSATTPAEYAREAIADGAPEESVHRLTRLFRRVQYGGVPSTDERTQAAIDAVREIGREDDE